MHQFPGSLFFTEKREKSVSPCIAKRLSIPLFIRGRTKSKSDRARLDKDHVLKKYTYEKLVGEEKQEIKNENQKKEAKCIKIPPSRKTSLSDTERKMPPNQYNLQEPAKNRVGLKGAYWSITTRHTGNIFVEEKKETNNAEPKVTKLSAPHSSNCSKYKGVFNGDPRSRRPSERFMVMDPGLCWRDPNTPGPLHYYPKNYTIEQSISKPKKNVRPLIWKFLQNSVVPDPQLSVNTTTDSSIPGPGRYNPYEVACACHRKDAYTTDGAWQIFQEKIKKFRGYPVKPIHREFCEHPRWRNVKGRGHTSIFRSKTVRIIPKSAPSEIVDAPKPFKTSLGKTYLCTLKHPRRTTISFRGLIEWYLLQKQPHVLFNSTYRPTKKKRSHMRSNIAFMSGMPRFPDSNTFYRSAPRVKFERKSHYGARRSFFYKPAAYGKKASKVEAERLSRVPARFTVQKIKLRERVFTFNRLPKPENLFIHCRDISKDFTKNIKHDLDIQQFFKDEYRVGKKLDILL